MGECLLECIIAGEHYRHMDCRGGKQQAYGKMNKNRMPIRNYVNHGMFPIGCATGRRF